MQTRNKFEIELSKLHTDLVAMGAMVEDAIGRSVQALLAQDAELARGVIDGDKEVKQKTAQIESAALKILLRQQPVASDLRVISTALKIVTDIERIGQQAANICSMVLHLCDEKLRMQLIDIPQMAELAKVMVKMCIDAFVQNDIELANKAIKTDAEMDDLFNKVKQDMIDSIRNGAEEFSEYADQAIYLVMIAKHFEKIGDHAENVAEWVIFSMTGKHKNIRLI